MEDWLIPRRGQFQALGPLVERLTNRQVGAAYVERSSRIQVLSDIVRVEYPDETGDVGLHWHVSVSVYLELPGAGSQARRTPTNDELARVVDCFEVPAWLEDNHEPGLCRHLWCPVDPVRRMVCPCQINEVQVMSLSGVSWSLTDDYDEAGTRCPGCAMVNIGVAPECQIHDMIGRRPELVHG